MTSNANSELLSTSPPSVSSLNSHTASNSTSNTNNKSSSGSNIVANTTTPPSNATTTANNVNFSGYLMKWTNYIKGYQKRWFVLNNGLLSYFRSQAEMAHTCRGTINLCNSIIQSEDSFHFVVTNGGQQTFHLKASNELEKQKWVSALEIAKNKSKQYSHNMSGGIGGFSTSSHINGNNQTDNSDDEENNSIEAEKNELANMLRVLQQKLDDLSTSHEFVLKHSSALTKSLTELESIQSKPDEITIKTINERSTVYKITMLAVVNACQEFINLAQLQTRKMHKVLQSERDMRSKLEDMVQEMAKQHLNFQNQLNKRSKRNTLVKSNNASGSAANVDNSNTNQASSSAQILADYVTSTNKKQTDLTDSIINRNSGNNYSNKSIHTGKNNRNDNEDNDEDDDDEDENEYHDEFHDAVEDETQFTVTLPRQKGVLHHRNPSNLSKIYLQESDISSEDEHDNQTIKVTMHTTHNTNEQQNDESNNKQEQTGGTLVVVNNNNNNKQISSNDLNSLKQITRQIKQRRKEITARPNYSLNLWSIMKNCIGKDLSKIPIPVNFSEPISMLQRVTEEMEYSNLLDLASQSADQWEQMAYVAAFTVSSYSTTATRTNKPFNPLLGETYECDRLDDYGWRSLAEQVSHHPPGFAIHVESLKEWIFYQEFTMSSKFRGQYLQIVPLGTSHLEFKKTGHHYTWRKVATFVKNIIVGKLWIDNVGEMDIVNHLTKDVCHLKFFPYSYFSREPPRKVTGIITDSNNVARYVLNGTWTEQIEGAPVLNPQVVTEQTQLNTGTSKILWRRKYPPPHLEAMYNFTELAVQLNELEPGVAPTDTRLRPDQRLMENAQWDEANREKVRLEEKQRTARKLRESAYAESSSVNGTNETNSNDNEDNQHALMMQNDYEPQWFKKAIDPFTNQPIHLTKNEYWDCKDRKDWKRCPDIY